MAERFTADVNLTVDELAELCDLASDAIIQALNGQGDTSPERFQALRGLFNKAHDAWNDQIIAKEVGNVLAAAAETGKPVPPEVTAYVAGNFLGAKPAIPLEIPTDPDEPCKDCGHFHSADEQCPRDGKPCSNRRCCNG